MNFTFSGETERERRLFLAVVRNLLNLNLDELETTVAVSFVADPAPELHNEFAYTEGASIEIRTDAPDFAGLDPTGQQWGMPFFNEVVAHELCHVLLALMDGSDQEKIAAMFGATPADWGDGARWEDRPLEGICETFKDAFLPRRHRRYANRTNHRIPIHKYGRFRRLFRRLARLALEVDPFDSCDLGTDPSHEYFWTGVSDQGGAFTYDPVDKRIERGDFHGPDTAGFSVNRFFRTEARVNGLRGFRCRTNASYANAPNMGNGIPFTLIVKAPPGGDTGTFMDVRVGNNLNLLTANILVRFVTGGVVQDAIISPDIPFIDAFNNDCWILCDVTGNDLAVSVYTADPRSSNPIGSFATTVPPEWQAMFGAGVEGWAGAQAGFEDGGWLDDFILGGALIVSAPELPVSEVAVGSYQSGSVPMKHRVMG